MHTDNSKITNDPRDAVVQEHLGVSSKAAEEAVRHAQASLTEAGVAAKVLADQGLDAVRKGVDKVEVAAARFSDRASTYVQEQPLKALLIATTAGALIAIAAGLASRR